jgi:hypothetical protein
VPHPNYRQLAFATYPQHCANCNFGVKEVLEVAHLEHSRSNNDPVNLAILCPNCHKMHDLGLIPSEVIVIMRAHPLTVSRAKRMKDAGAKAAASRKKRIRR